jgi:tetratricopeptide (TPR) repeat protein
MADPVQIVSQLNLSAEEEYQLHLERGRRALNAGNLIEAKSETDRCLASRPSDSGALNLRALLLFKLEEYDDAVKIFEQLVERFPDEAVLRNSLGLGYLKKNDYVTAAKHFERACLLDKNYSKARNYLGFCYQNLGRFKDARDEFLLGGSRSMAARMEELILQAEEAAARELNDVAQAAVQDDLDRMINEPEPERISFDLDEPAQKETVEKPASVPVLRNLSDITHHLRLTFSSDAPCTISADGILRVRGQSFARLRDAFCHIGSLEFRPRQKRYKGKDLKTSFGSDADPIHELVGEGLLFARPSGILSSLPLEDEVVYLQEDRVWAFAGDLRWENGRLPGEGAGDLLLVQFKGSGNVVLRLERPLRLLSLNGDLPAYLPADSVVGWFGEVVPRLTAISFPGTGPKTTVVEMKGSGQILFEMPEGTGMFPVGAQ